MDQELVEKITKLVISKLEEYTNPSVEHFVPLTHEELKKWDEIAIGFSKKSNSSLREDPEYKPLTQEEIKKWNQFTSSTVFSKENRSSFK
jgi:hypothetical protein